MNKEEIFFRTYDFMTGGSETREAAVSYLGQIKRFRKSTSGIGEVFYDEIIRPYVFSGYCLWLSILKKKGVDSITQIYTLVNDSRMNEFKEYYARVEKVANETKKALAKVTSEDFIGFTRRVSALGDQVMIADAIVSKFGDEGIEHVYLSMDMSRLSMLASMNEVYKDTFFNK